MKQIPTDISEADLIALRSLMASEHWGQFVSLLQRERDLWQQATRDPVVYQSHAELAHVSARVAEVDWLLELLESAKTGDGPAG